MWKTQIDRKINKKAVLAAKLSAKTKIFNDFWGHWDAPWKDLEEDFWVGNFKTEKNKKNGCTR